MKIFIINFLVLYICSTKESLSFKSGADVIKQTYLLICPNDMLIKNHLIHELLPHIWKSQKLSQAIA